MEKSRGLLRTDINAHQLDINHGGWALPLLARAWNWITIRKVGLFVAIVYQHSCSVKFEMILFVLLLISVSLSLSIPILRCCFSPISWHSYRKKFPSIASWTLFYFLVWLDKTRWVFLLLLFVIHIVPSLLLLSHETGINCRGFLTSIHCPVVLQRAPSLSLSLSLFRSLSPEHQAKKRRSTG